VVGDVVRLRDRLAWYEKKPLFGRRIVVTRPRAQAAAFIDLLADAGAEVIPFASIEIVAPDSWQPLDDAIRRSEEFDWVVFTSVNGVRVFFERIAAIGRDVRCLHRARLAAVGTQTQRALAERGLLVDVVPREFRAEGVAEAMRAAGLAGAKILLPRAAGAREILPALLRQAGASVEEVVSYRSVPAASDAAGLRSLLERGRIDVVTFTSSSTVRGVLDALGDGAAALLGAAAIGCIGPITAETAREAGLQVAIQPFEYTVAAFARAIVAYYAGEPVSR
jgi:uroporphyrinogen III methyltransferase/synthase